MWNTSLVPIQWAKPHDATEIPQLLCVKLEDLKKITSQTLRRSRAVIHLDETSNERKNCRTKIARPARRKKYSDENPRMKYADEIMEDENQTDEKPSWNPAFESNNNSNKAESRAITQIFKKGLLTVYVTGKCITGTVELC